MRTAKEIKSRIAQLEQRTKRIDNDFLKAFLRDEVKLLRWVLE